MNTLRQAVQEYVQMRRDLGFKLHEPGKGLLDFVNFMEQHRASYITQALALAWAQQPSKAQPAYWAQRLSFVRGFARYRSATDPRTQIPARACYPSVRGGRGHICTRMPRFVSLLRAALNMPYRYKRGQVASLDLLLSVRVTERLWPAPRRSTQPRASRCRSQSSGVDHPRHQVRQDSSGAFTCLDVRSARRLHRQTQTHWAAAAGVLLLVRLQLRQSAWMVRDIHRTFYALSRQIGLRGPSDSHGPRLHDMRHRFATHTLVHWYRSNQDPERKLPSCPPTSAMCTSPIRSGI